VRRALKSLLQSQQRLQQQLERIERSDRMTAVGETTFGPYAETKPDVSSTTT
jgi:hypothetical protein